MKVRSPQQMLRLLPRRKRTDNKTAGGKCLIIAGSKGMWGASVLCASSAARVGAGYVYLLKTETKKDFPIAENPNFLILEREQLQLNTFKSVAVGPGLRNNKVLKNYLHLLLKEKFLQVVLDAEALNELAQWPKQKKLPSSWIVTPHEGEAGRLLQQSSTSVRLNRVAAARSLQKRLGCVVVLKGHHTLVASENLIEEISSGNVALAKAGTGDVLTGIIAGLLSQGLKSHEAAALGAYLHGCLADEWIKEKDPLSLLASDLVENLPVLLRRFRNRKLK